jgi:protein-disulfide isomerase
VAAPPPVRSTGGGGARQASPKVLGIAGGVMLLVIVAIVLAVVLGRNGSSVHTGPGNNDGPTVGLATGTPTVGSSTKSSALGPPAQGATDVAALLKGIPQSGFVLGDPKAPVTLIEYIDLQCPDCLQFEETELKPLIDNYVRTGKLKIKMQPWSILDRTPDVHDSDRGQKATIAASMQNKGFNFAQVLYDNQGTEETGWMNDAMISRVAASVDGLKPYQLVKDANGGAVKNLVSTITGFAAAHPTQMTGTPTLYLQKGNGNFQYYGTGVPELRNLEAAIDLLAKK